MSPTGWRQALWGTLSAIGLASVGWTAAHAPAPATFFAAVTSRWSTLTISLDLLGLGVAATSFAVIESYRLGMRWPWIWVLLAIPLPGASMLPFFLLLRERTLARGVGELPAAGAPSV